MKILAALLLLTVTVCVAVYWHDSPEPLRAQTPDVAEPVSRKPHVSEQRVSKPQLARSAQPPGPSPLPPSFSGTQVDGRLHADSAGNLIIDGDIRRVFDYFLASIGEESIDASVTRLRQYIQAQLPQPAAGRATQLLGQYLDYKRQLMVLENNHARQPDLDAMRARLQAVRQLRAGIFDDATHQAFFALEEAADSFTLERLAIRHDQTLNATDQGAALDRLRSNLPPELQDTVALQMQTELREQTLALQASGGGSMDLRIMRQRLVGNAATARLEALDSERREWQSRITAYQEEKKRILSSRGLGEADKRAAIDRLAMQRFGESERLRLEAAERLLTTTDT